MLQMWGRAQPLWHLDLSTLRQKASMMASRPRTLSFVVLVALLASSLLLTPALSAPWGLENTEQAPRRILRQADRDFDPVARVLEESSDDEAPAPSFHGRGFLDVSIVDDSASLSSDAGTVSTAEEDKETAAATEAVAASADEASDEVEDDDEDAVDEDTPASRGMRSAAIYRHATRAPAVQPCTGNLSADPWHQVCPRVPSGRMRYTCGAMH